MPDGGVRFTRAGYHRLVEGGLLGPDPRVELLNGEIVMMSPIGPWQGALVRRLTRFFIKNLPDSIECSAQLPIIVENHSEPEPDIALVRSRDDDYQQEHPSPVDAVLLVEVSQSSLRIDLGKKLHVYAAAGVSEYWVVDIEQKRVVVHREPFGQEYRSVESFSSGESIAPLAAPMCELELDWLFH